RNARLATVGERDGAPGAINGDPQQLRTEAAELVEQFVVERHLVAADRAPVSGVEGEDYRSSPKVTQGDELIRRRMKREVGRARPGGKDVIRVCHVSDCAAKC